MISVFRLEHEDGDGIFTERSSEECIGRHVTHPLLRLIWERHSTENKNHFPTPKAEGLQLSKDHKEWFCAYKNLEVFQKFIMPHELKELHCRKISLLLLVVAEYQVGRMQALYTKQSIIESINITHFLNTLNEPKEINPQLVLGWDT